jgi:hypothetical protein
MLNTISVESVLWDKIVMFQDRDEGIKTIKQRLSQNDPKYTCFRQDPNGTIWFRQCLVIPKNPTLRKEILDEAHLSKFLINPGSSKMYQHLKGNFWWSNMKVDIAKYVSECDTCSRIKASHLKIAGTLQPLPYPLGSGMISAWIQPNLSLVEHPMRILDTKERKTRRK